MTSRVFVLLLVAGLGLPSCGDDENTSSCIPACAASQCMVCQDGRCVSSCTADQVCENGTGTCVPAEVCDPACDAELCLVCDDGSCVSSCTTGQICDNGNCVVDNSCSPPCDAESCMVCDGGSCVYSCSASQICDHGTCVDDIGCNPPCDAELCLVCDEAGNCVSSCTMNQSCDNGTCVDENVCNPPCDANACMICVQGECVSSCAQDQICDEGECVADNNCNPACDANLCMICVQSDCVSSCAGNQVCENGSCVLACVPEHEICNNGQDDDCDGMTDCDDPGCSSAWSEDMGSGECIAKCVQNGTCLYGLFDENTLNNMAFGILYSQKVSHEDDGYFHFAVISDPHISDDPGVNNEQPGSYGGTYTSKQNPFAPSKLKKILNTIGASDLHIAFVVVTGDLVDIGETADFQQYADGVAAFMRETSIPVFSVAGNHDLWDYGSADANCIAHYMYNIGDPDYDFEFENSVFVVTNNANSGIRKSTGAIVSVDFLYALHGGTFAELTGLLSDYRASYFSDSATSPQWTIRDDQISKVQTALAQSASYHFGFTHLPVSHDWVPASGYADDSDAVQYQKYEDLFASRSGHAVFSGHTHVLDTLPLGNSGPAKNYILRDAYRGSWALIDVSPQHAVIQHKLCDAAGNNCMNNNGAALTLLP